MAGKVTWLLAPDSPHTATDSISTGGEREKCGSRERGELMARRVSSLATGLLLPTAWGSYLPHPLQSAQRTDVDVDGTTGPTLRMDAN